MKVKIVWIICGLFLVIVIWQLIITSNIVTKAKTATISKRIAGQEISLPPPEKKDLIRPPEKISGASEPQIGAKAAILIDVPSAYVLYEKNMEAKVPIASTTKIMTAVVVIDDFGDKLNDVVTITYPMIAVEGSDIQLKVGEKITVANLLKGLLIMSGNDTANALAIHFGGKEAFVERMNQKAKELGLENTYFRDPAGLDDEGFSTAHDLALLASFAMRKDLFREIVKTPQTTITSVGADVIHELKSSNRLIKNDDALFYPFAIGIKTGFTYAAGHCLVSAAQNNGHEILGVILNTNENSITASAAESRKLLEWGFANWQWK